MATASDDKAYPPSQVIPNNYLAQKYRAAAENAWTQIYPGIGTAVPTAVGTTTYTYNSTADDIYNYISAKVDGVCKKQFHFYRINELVSTSEGAGLCAVDKLRLKVSRWLNNN